MQRFTPPQRLFAYAVAALAGFVDITGFLQLDGYFVSFMTGNTTLLARDLAGGMHRVAVPAVSRSAPAGRRVVCAARMVCAGAEAAAGDSWTAQRVCLHF